ncbi:tRNA pseudouridine(38-40) synthase TruA [Oceanobacillus piezotolerans]|uniref:tRNA pseudouridine synthase A n=1 Tax=Oceanobacillus piezotolerans TaxID=2448030 RepID=A0A498D6A2_9BACI|nr:tRNA pseudouridine(38-40) synthase TruA [Oceanobacillus piezotolerans]RLL40722.1 tRNA pseudouridine(38-40) synthase TruA [Oceanobacillus piezotolerans]
MGERIKCTIQYDGTLFHGFQIQPNKRTVQGELEKALSRVHKGSKIKTVASGRTDSGVHAKGQVIHFDSILSIPSEGWKQALNTQLPDDIYIIDVKRVSSAFHARYGVSQKEYHYIVLNRPDTDVFNRNYSYHFPYEIDIDKILEACRYLEGTHDFTTLSSAKSTVKGTKVRTIYEANCIRQGDKLTFVFRGSGFLYNMVRIMVSVLLDIGQGRRKPEDIPKMIEKKDRSLAGKTIAPQGLYLWKVTYDDQEEINPS